MLYVGSFGFYNEEEEMSNQFLYFADADDPDAAEEIFKASIWLEISSAWVRFWR